MERGIMQGWLCEDPINMGLGKGQMYAALPKCGDKLFL